MKKTILVIVAMASITLIGTQAFACYYDGYWGGPMGGPMAGFYSNVYSGGNYQRFFDNTAQLRQDLATKRGEYNALLTTTDPDPKMVAQLNRVITVLNDQLSARARSYRMPAPPAGNGYGYGRMDGYGGWGGYGCW